MNRIVSDGLAVRLQALAADAAFAETVIAGLSDELDQARAELARRDQEIARLRRRLARGHPH